MHFYNGSFFGMHFLWWAFWIVIFFVIVYATNNNKQTRTQSESPLEILKKRFANGEISKEEYEQSKRLLNQ